jgi:hypothetical protein
VIVVALGRGRRRPVIPNVGLCRRGTDIRGTR